MVSEPDQLDVLERRPAYTFRRERLGEWAVVLILLLFAGLWLCWPAGRYRSKVPERQPEPQAAYVQVVFSGNPLMHHPDHFTHMVREGAEPAPALSLLPPAPPPPLPPPPAYADVVVDPVGLPAVRPREKLPSIPLVAGPPIDPLSVQAVPQGRITRLSPALQAAQFRFEMPASSSGGTGRVTYQIVLGSDGRVARLLDESTAGNEHSRAWRQALLRGSGVTNASGFVEVEW